MRLKTVAVIVVVALLAGGAAVFLSVVRHGFSARDQPSRVETVMARSIRSMGIPSRVKQLPNPIAVSPDVLADARAHFADHCALCHANDGSGNTEIGQSLYPKAPDMRLAPTQSLSDGELYYIIQNGVRLTGMPAWGMNDDDAEEDSWKLVHFIRHLSELTPEQIEEMEKQNPRNPAEIEEEREEQEFLRGGAEPSGEPKKPPAPHHRH